MTKPVPIHSPAQASYPCCRRDRREACASKKAMPIELLPPPDRLGLPPVCVVAASILVQVRHPQ